MNARLNRLFAADGKCFDVAVDHGFFGEGSFLTGIENMAKTVATSSGGWLRGTLKNRPRSLLE